MRRTIFLAAAAAGLICGLAPAGAAEPKAPAGGAGRLVYEDDFSRTDLGGRWTIHPNSYVIRDGVMVGAQQPGTTHGAVGRVAVDVKDAAVEFDFRFEGSPRFNVVFNDHGYKGSHAGHICRVGVTPKALTLGDDKEGQYKNEIYQLRMDPKTKGQAEPLLKGRSTQAAVNLERGKWYRMAVAVVGDEMRVALDGKPMASLKSPGIAHPTKSEFGFTVSGKEVHFDNLSIRIPADGK